MRKLDLQEFIDEIFFDFKQNPDTKYLFFLGAGCSKSSGIPLARELAEEWYEKLKHQTSKFDKFNTKNKISNSKSLDYAKYYFEIFEELFPTPLSQQKEIQRITEDRTPSSGYYALSALMQEPSFNTVITTNFDNLIQDALIYSGHKRALVITHQDLAKFIKRDDTPLITKIHGDAHMHPFNNSNDTKKIPNELKVAIQALFTNTKVICMGYGGDDESIADLLNGCNGIDQVYWLNSTEPKKVKLKDWWEKFTTKTYISECDFDRIMRSINSKFSLSAPNFEYRAKVLKDSYDNSVQDDTKVIEKIKNKTYSDYFTLGYNYNENKDYNKAIDSYKKAIKINPKYTSAYTNMGNVYNRKKEYNSAIDAYKKAIEINPKYTSAYTNLFESYIIQNKPLDTNLEQKYISLFERDKNKFIKYEMLKIILNILQNKEVDINKWLKDYEKENLGNWSFEELEQWIETKSGKIKEKLLDAITIFKTKQ